MSVRSKMALGSALALLALLLTFYVGGRFILLKTFRLVEQEVMRSVPSLINAVHGELRQLDLVTDEAADHKPVIEAIGQRRASFATESFPVTDLVREDISLIAVADTEGRLVSALYRPAESAETRQPSASLQQQLTPKSPLLTFAPATKGLCTGLIMLDEGPMLVASRRLPRDLTQPMEGVLLVGRHLQDAEVMQRLAAALPGLRLDRNLHRIELRTNLGPDGQMSPGEIISSRWVEISPWQSVSSGYEALLPVYDVYGHHALSLVLGMPRTFGAMAEMALAWLSLFVALIGILSIAPLLVLQGYTVLDPLTRLADEIRALRPHGRLDGRLKWNRRDEFGIVADAVDEMLDAIEQDRRQIEESESRNRALLEANPDLLFLCDREGRLLDVKIPSGIEQPLLSPPAQASVGRLLRDVRELPPDVRERLMDQLAAAFDTGQLQTMEFHMTTPEGQDFWGEARVVRIDENRALAIARNMTDRYKAERGRRLLEVRIGQKQKMESLGLLASGIAHDFNNILAAILGHAEETMTRLPENTPAADAIGSIRSAAIRASGLTKQLQAYAGQGSFEFRRVNLNQLLGDMSQLLRSSLSKKAVFSMVLEPQLPMIEGDPSQLWQVAMNLLLNASEALDDKAGSVVLSTRRIQATTSDLGEFLSVNPLAPGVYVLLEISDTGKGMSHEVLARIFDPFFSTKSKGRGLGLSAVVGIVQAHGGGITVRSAPGAGTIFKVLLPAAPEAAGGDTSADGTVSNGSLLASEPLLQASNRLVLVAEDEPDIRTVTKLALRTAGYDVMVAENGRVAVEMFARRAREIALVLLDVEMPEMNGEESFRAIRALRSDVPILVMTGYGDVSAQTRFKDLKPAGILAKPFTRAQLLSTLMQALRDSGATVLERQV